MKMVLAMLKILISKLDIRVFVMIMVLTWMKYGWMEVGFIQRHMEFLAMEERLYKGLFHATLQDI